GDRPLPRSNLGGRWNFAERWLVTGIALEAVAAAVVRGRRRNVDGLTCRERISRSIKVPGFRCFMRMSLQRARVIVHSRHGPTGKVIPGATRLHKRYRVLLPQHDDSA